MRFRRNYAYNIEINFKQLRCGDVDWIHLVLDKVQWPAFVRSVMNLGVEIKS
jgi:hypothetical protein